ncbi:MAG: hypothetical protein KGJ09_05345 [Candidatus Omnitrophica bacterium]|nr:hypothetical protein [Candidatus Omnitrophota bacterium]MDE2009488.1 hypothetical protein [Candidatus Omnitrophota bacterium]MDE2215090.1 hypothetical protein [Candidatus Omnitrophota bacterium]MDE2232051.1 hypothetical protein [Candidatus Omnitrophota bacterium]
MARRFILENKHQPLLAYPQFLRRMMRCTIAALVLLTGTLFLGCVGYHFIENQAWIDALLNSVLVMTGIGLENGLNTFNGKVFTIGFSLLSPIVFYSILAILFTPLIHRFLHSFHLDK